MSMSCYQFSYFLEGSSISNLISCSLSLSETQSSATFSQTRSLTTPDDTQSLVSSFSTLLLSNSRLSSTLLLAIFAHQELGMSTGVRTFRLRTLYRSSDPNFSIQTFAKNQHVQYLGIVPLIYDKNTHYLLSRIGNKVFNTNFYTVTMV